MVMPSADYRETEFRLLQPGPKVFACVAQVAERSPHKADGGLSIGPTGTRFSARWENPVIRQAHNLKIHVQIVAAQPIFTGL